MAQPTQRALHVDKILTNISVAFMMDTSQFISRKVFPSVPVDFQSDKYYVYNRADWMRDEAKRRGVSEESAGSGWTIGQDSYYAEVWAFHKDLDDQIRGNADANFRLDSEASQFVTQTLLLRQENHWVQRFFVPGVWATDMLGTAVAGSVDSTHFLQWNDPDSDPLEDIEEGKQKLISTTGYEANTLVMGYKVARRLRNHPDIVDRIKYTQTGIISEDLLAGLLNVDRVMVAKAIQNSSAEGIPASYNFIAGNNALLCHSAPSPGLLTPSAGYTFVWTGLNGIGTDGPQISRFRMENIKSDRIEGEIAFDDKIVASDLGYYFSAAVA